MTSVALRRGLVVQLGVILLALTGFGLEQDVGLLVRLKIAADDAFAMGSAGSPLLMEEDRDVLRSYSPARIAAFIRFPNARIRAVAFLSLAYRPDDNDVREWEGMTPSLIAAFLNETDTVARQCAWYALLNLGVDAADVAALVDEAFEDGTGNTLRGSLLRAGARSENGETEHSLSPQNG